MTISPRTRHWWKHAVVYQIYPASFYDSNGDGIGDIPGITAKLDYVASLGVDAIWVSPMYQSPQVDMGYDISDYEEVYPPYGTIADMETLIRETHERGMRILLDLVINHTSDQHTWFKESRSSRHSAKRDWYIWRPANYSATGERLPPNNWRSAFGGGSAWEWDEQTEQYYLHIWAKEQPDLNWDCQQARQAIYESAIKFWLRRGVDGFRVDTVNMYSKPHDFPDAPVTDPKAPFQPAAALYCNGPRIHEYISEVKQVLGQYGAITVGELPDTSVAEVLRYVSAGAQQLDMVFQFDAVEIGWGRTHKYETTPKNFSLPGFKKALGQTQEMLRGTDAWTTIFLENHDLARSVSWLTDDRPEYRARCAKLLALMQCCLSGTQFVYQGQEIGTVNAPMDSYPFEYYEDISSRQFMGMVKDRYGSDNKVEIDKAFAALQHLGRDHARIPIVWDGKAESGGFSLRRDGQTIQEPWMRPHPLASEINVESQLEDNDSVLAFWRKMLRFRKQHDSLFVYGDYRCLDPESPDLYTFVKEAEGGRGLALVVLNFTDKTQLWSPPSLGEQQGFVGGNAASFVPIVSTDHGKTSAEHLAPYEGRVYFQD